MDLSNLVADTPNDAPCDAPSDAPSDDSQSEFSEETETSSDESESSDSLAIQKKRGRKPKTKVENDLQKVPKKRGRKPKEKVYSVKEFPKSFLDDNKNETYILHLPIKSEEVTYDNQPFPNNYSTYTNTTDLSPKLETKIEDLPIEKYDQNNILKKNLKNIMYEFINMTNYEKVWPESTNIACWWCCHSFKNVPCSLPEYYIKGKFYVDGCFCSFNCAAAYNFRLGDANVWERYSLLQHMHKILLQTKITKIPLAPPVQSLTMFGGYLSIEEFRENFHKNDKMYSLIKPPLVSILSKIEEKNMRNNIPTSINENILSKTQNTLKLKRNKPIINPNNTLQSFMDLKIT